MSKLDELEDDLELKKRIKRQRKLKAKVTARVKVTLLQLDDPANSANLEALYNTNVRLRGVTGTRQDTLLQDHDESIRKRMQKLQRDHKDLIQEQRKLDDVQANIRAQTAVHGIPKDWPKCKPRGASYDAL